MTYDPYLHKLSGVKFARVDINDQLDNPQERLEKRVRRLETVLESILLICQQSNANPKRDLARVEDLAKAILD